MPGPIRDKGEAFAALEAIMLRQMLQSSGAFRPGATPGGELRRDMFIETLADAVTKAGGLGIARMLERQLGGGGAATAGPAAGAGAATAPAPLPLPQRSPVTMTAGGGAGRAAAPIDDLDDANSEAPLPEDPDAASIDDFQPGAAGAAPVKTGAGASGAPALGATGDVTSAFGRRTHPISGDQRFHTGVDLRAAEGTPIHAAGAGVVREAGRRGGYGRAVEIDHGDGTTTLYAHASELLVAQGQRVVAGQPIARVGHSGQATGPHLHFELRRNDHPVDPGLVAMKTLPVGIALNRYRERVEDSVAGSPSETRIGDRQ